MLSVRLSVLLGQLPGVREGKLHGPKGLSQQQPSPNKIPPNLQQGQGLGRPQGDEPCFPVPPPVLTDMCVSGLPWVHKRVGR